LFHKLHYFDKNGNQRSFTALENVFKNRKMFKNMQGLQLLLMDIAGMLRRKTFSIKERLSQLKINIGCIKEHTACAMELSYGRGVNRVSHKTLDSILIVKTDFTLILNFDIRLIAYCY